MELLDGVIFGAAAKEPDNCLPGAALFGGGLADGKRIRTKLWRGCNFEWRDDVPCQVEMKKSRKGSLLSAATVFIVADRKVVETKAVGTVCGVELAAGGVEAQGRVVLRAKCG